MSKSIAGIQFKDETPQSVDSAKYEDLYFATSPDNVVQIPVCNGTECFPEETLVAGKEYALMRGMNYKFVRGFKLSGELVTFEIGVEGDRAAE